tara:strand:- start:2396 stop:3148 length:753 start_codon:yes stop_codon:yes gene_type:complete
MKKIPILATQTLNGVKNVKKLIESVDYPVEIFSLILNNENFDILIDLKKYCDSKPNEFIDKIEISWHPTNLGCAPSWNYHFKQYPYAEYFVKADDDIEFSKGDLEVMSNTLANGNHMVFFNRGTKYACFGISKKTLKIVGLFDENVWPANYEDDDFQNRLRLSNINDTFLEIDIKHISSGTSRNLKDQKIEHAKLANFIVETQDYYNKKWGGNWPNCYKHPFNDPNINITNIDYKFEYRENKIFRCNYTI